MMDDSSTLPVAADAPRRVSTIAQLASIPEEEIWLSKQKSARTRRAYRLDVQHFMRTLVDSHPRRIAPGRPQSGDRLGTLHARGRARRIVDDPPTARGSVVAVQAPGPARPRCAQSGRRGRTAGDQSRRRLDPGLRQGAGAQTARPAERGDSRRAARSRDPFGRLAGWVAPRRDRGAEGRRSTPEPRL